jgi:hypothetical protein
MKVPIRDRNWLLILLALTFVRGLIYAAVVPPWQAPDENRHFERIWLFTRQGGIASSHDIPAKLEIELLGSLYEWHFGEFTGRSLPSQMPDRLHDLPRGVVARRSPASVPLRFSLSHVWPGIFVWPVRFHSILTQLLVARISSVVLNLIIVYLVYLTMSELAPPSESIILPATLVAVFLPQHTFINSTVGDGPLAEAMACTVIYAWTRVFGGRVSAWEVIGIVLGTAVSIWSKATAIFLIPVDIGLFLWWIWRSKNHSSLHKPGWQSWIAVVGAILILCLWSRSPLGMRTFDSLRRFVSVDVPTWTDERGMSLAQAIRLMYETFWANFGWMKIPIGARWYGAIWALSAIAAVGWICPFSTTKAWARPMMGGILMVAWGSMIWTMLLFPPDRGFYQYQGRYLFPTVIPFVFLFIDCLRRVFAAHWERNVRAVFVLTMVCFDTWCLSAYIVPYFYGI